MKILMSLGIVITLSLVSGSVKARAAGCDALGNVRFICDQLGPEDLVAVPGSEWVLSSGMAANGAIRLINQRDKSTTVLFPSETSTERPNKKIYDSCPGPIGFEGDKFRGAHTNDGGRGQRRGLGMAHEHWMEDRSWERISWPERPGDLERR